MLRQIGLQSLAPQPEEQAFDSWWERIAEVASGLHQQGLNSLVILGAWLLWKHRKRCVFYGVAPNMMGLLILAGEEPRLWTLAGA
ncbi:hypothetical protein PR202_gb03148 [Eleusine coracana subsp. coracana]|uniref:Uncharacterized protein n=1 Tax=Eleusine coracana subsp. coracana TaxID=191504 RepID=A0AAV5E0B7_ELECO|nr:hypothetical protein PR202_gb03148 [Eleusine coracana subsp. coracana]